MNSFWYSVMTHHVTGGSPVSNGPPGIASRNVSGRSWHNGQGQGALSPLSGPVLTGNDDDLFSMDN